MSPPTRRRLLRSGVVAVVLAGCSSLGGASGARLAGVALVNTTQTATTFHVAVESDGRTAYRESHEVPAAVDGRRRPTTRTVVPDAPAGSGVPAVRGRVGDQERRVDLADVEFAGECVVASFIWGKFEGELGTTVDRVVDIDNPPEAVDCGT